MSTEMSSMSETVPNDFVFALIGSDPPKGFLEQLDIEIPADCAAP